VVRALTPVNVRRDDEHLALGNRVSAMFPHLPVDVADPLERLRRVAAEMRALKARGDARAAGVVLALAGALPAPFGAWLGRLAPDQPLLSTVCTNVPGPREVRFLLGRPVEELHPIVPLFQGMGVEFAVMSYAGRLSIGVTADAGLVPDAERIAAALTDGMAELRRLLEAEEAAVEVRYPRGPRVADLMTREVVAIDPHASLAQAYRMMRERRIRHLPVVSPGGRLVGLVTHRDLLAASSSSLTFPGEIERLRILDRAQVGDVMETHLSVAEPAEDAAEAGRRMVRHKIGCLPVVHPGGGLTGIVTEEDYLRWATEHMATEGVHHARA
jgi:CBS domain-containing protein